MNNYTIGLDLGINNVGWSIYDNETNRIEKTGVRLFTSSDNAKDRRELRGQRRRSKRQKNRIVDIYKIFNNINFPSSTTIDPKLILTRNTAIKEKVSKQDIVNIICFFLKNRGYISFSDEEVNFVKLDDMLPCEYFLNLQQKIGKYRALNGETVKTEDNIKEIKLMLNTQKKYYPELDNNIINEILKIFMRKRAFWEGPGSFSSFTPYGRFKSEDDVVEYQNNKKQNNMYEKYIFEDLIGKCSIEINEKCVPRANYYAEKFNLLNDFINVSIKNVENVKNQDYFNFDKTKKVYKFSKLALEEIFNYCITNKKIEINKMLKQLFSFDINNIDGYRTDKQGNSEFSTMSIYRSVINVLNTYDCSLKLISDINIYNKIIYYMALVPDSVSLINVIKNDSNIDYNFSIKEEEIIKEVYLKLKKNNSLSYASLSEKVLKRAIDDMLSTQLNFMQVKKKFDYEKNAREYFIKQYNKDTNNLPLINPKFVDNIISSPQVKKTLRQAIKIINNIVKEKKQLPYIISIESTKEMNGKDTKKAIEAIQRKKEILKTNAKKIIEENFGIKYINDINIEKIMLYNEINGVCPYCGETLIKLDDIINNKIEIEHILPKSKSFDDSYENKTISCSKCNHSKNNKTPYYYLNPINQFDIFEKRINDLNNISDQKRERFLFKGDIDKYTTRFFNRNLRDTAYATTELVKQINIFNYYLESVYNNTKIFTLSTPGQLTSKVRSQFDLLKDRDDGKYHHAVDASIVAAISNTELGRTIIESQNNSKFWINNKNKIENISNLIYDFSLKSFKKELDNYNSDDKILISSQIQKNPQKSFANANIYKILKKDNDYFKIEQIPNIYQLDMSKEKDKNLLAKLFDDSYKKLTLLCYDNDKKLYEKLKSIYKKYSNEKGNPFVNYAIDKFQLINEKFDMLKHGIKVSDKLNSPIVVRLRYYSNITSPYLLEKNNIHKKDNTLIGFDSLAQVYTEIYADLDKKEFIFLPVSSISINMNNKKIKENDKYYMYFYNKYIENKNVEFITRLYNNNYISIIKKSGEIICGECQSYDKSVKRIRLKNGKSFVQSDIAFTLYDIDNLGNKKIRLTYKIK